MDQDHRCADRFLALSARTIVGKRSQSCVRWGYSSVPLLN